MRPMQTMETMYEAMLERRKSLVKKDTALYQFDGSDRFSILYYNQQRDAAFAKARIPPFGDGQVVNRLPAEPSMVHCRQDQLDIQWHFGVILGHTCLENSGKLGTESVKTWTNSIWKHAVLSS
jgi:hypothetical protein